MSPLLPRRTQRDLATGMGSPTPAFALRPRARRPHCSIEATPGFAAHYNLRGCALPLGSASSGTECVRLPLAPPSSYPGALPSPGAGLPPASLTATTVYGRGRLIHFSVWPPARADLGRGPGRADSRAHEPPP